MRHILIGAISGNYTTDNLINWVETSNYPDIERVLFYYNPTNDEIFDFCKTNNISIITPDFDFYGQNVKEFLSNSGLLTIENSPLLIHHVRFLHWWYFLKDLTDDDLVILTDVNDIIFNNNPFIKLKSFNHKGIIASSEEVTHSQETWNLENFWTTFGMITNDFSNKKIYNAGTISGTAKIISDLCRDIYLLSINKPRNADQAAYNYLIQTSYKPYTKFTDMHDNWGIHLHVVNAGLVPFDLNNIKNYTIIHQYDRIPNFKR